jgi:hypothetical protein
MLLNHFAWVRVYYQLCLSIPATLIYADGKMTFPAPHGDDIAQYICVHRAGP